MKSQRFVYEAPESAIIEIGKKVVICTSDGVSAEGDPEYNGLNSTEDKWWN